MPAENEGLKVEGQPEEEGVGNELRKEETERELHHAGNGKRLRNADTSPSAGAVRGCGCVIITHIRTIIGLGWRYRLQLQALIIARTDARCRRPN